MADVTITVGPGKTYASLSAAFAAYAGSNLTTSFTGSGGGPGKLNIVCYAFDDSTSADTGSGWTTSASYYINIYTDPSARHAGVWDNSKYYLAPNGSALLIRANYTRITGLQLQAPSGNHVVYFIASYIWISSCIVVGAGYADTSSQIGIYNNYGSTYSGNCIWDCIFYGFGNASGAGSIIISDNYNTGTVYSCTMLGGWIAAYYVGTMKNCYAGKLGAGSYSGGVFHGTSTMVTCASEDTSGSSGLTGIVANTTNFTNVTSGSENLSLPTGSALIGVGTDTTGDTAPMNFTVDITGATRTDPWDIGAFKSTGGGGGGNWLRGGYWWQPSIYINGG
jgi:hypothetical protein